LISTQEMTMGTRRLMTAVVLGTLTATSVLAQDAPRRRPGAEDRGRGQESRGRRAEPSRPESSRPESNRPESNREQPSSPRTPESRAVERADRDRRDERAREDSRRRDNDRRDNDRRDDSRRDEARRDQWRRDNDRRDDGRRNDWRRNDGRRYYYNPYRRSYAPWVHTPRIIRPRVVTIVPWRPYIYRPSIGIGIYYGTGDAYPYGYTPEAYYNPTPGRIYGGVRIVDAPRDAQVFADGYYVGIVDDFDGVFQHVNLEPGEHRIEIVETDREPVAFDVLVQPGQTLTLRADME
jgi:hypothetical protein